MKDHRLIDERSLAFDRLIAAKLRANPALLEKARSNVARWLESSTPAAPAAFREWQHILDGPFDSILAQLESTDQRATRLRQSSPFAGLLTEDERWEILREFQARDYSA